MPISQDEFAVLIAVELPGLPAEQQGQLAHYLSLVSAYGGVLNLTAYYNKQALFSGLVSEALRLMELGEITRGIHVADLGSGNGSPVIPLAVTLPETYFLAIESRLKRATFLKQVVTSLGLSNIEVQHGRVEDVVDAGQRFEMVISRAFAQPDELLPLAKMLLAPGGEVRGYLGAAPGPLAEAASALGLTVVNLLSYQHRESTRHIYRLQA